MKLKKLITFSFILLFLADLLQYLSSSARLNYNATIAVGALKFLSLICVLVYSNRLNWSHRLPKIAKHVLQISIVYNIVVLFHGVFVAKSYWDWKFIFLNNTPSLLMPYISIVGLYFFENIDLTRFIFHRVLKFSILFLLLGMGLYTRSVIFLPFILLLCVYFPRKWRYWIYFLALLSALTSLGFRANILRLFISISLIALFYYRNIFKVLLLRFVLIILFVVPVIFLFLGISGQFNVFSPVDSDKQSFVISSQVGEENLAADTRTFLYVEVFNSLKSHNAFLFGEGAAGKYVSAWFNDIDRYGAEVGFLNILLYSGITGVIIHLLVFGCAAYYALNHSKNYLSKMLAVFLGFRWVLLFVEDITQYDLNFYFLWIVVGLCFSRQFRAMSDKDLAIYFHTILK